MLAAGNDDGSKRSKESKESKDLLVQRPSTAAVATTSKMATSLSLNASFHLEELERICLIGKGTFGKAWLMRHSATKKEIVAKEIKVSSKSDLDDALREAEVLSRLDCEHIIK